MKIYEIRTRNNAEVYAFEIDSGIGRRKTVTVVRSIDRVSIAEKSTGCDLSEAAFCEFSILGDDFHVFEPFGDSSRYWIGPKDNKAHPGILLIIDAFMAYKPFMFGS